MGGGGGQANYERSGSLKAITTHLKPGYYWKNGMPYTGNAVLKENFFLLQLPDNSTWLTITQLVEDPEYLIGSCGAALHDHLYPTQRFCFRVQ